MKPIHIYSFVLLNLLLWGGVGLTLLYYGVLKDRSIAFEDSQSRLDDLLDLHTATTLQVDSQAHPTVAASERLFIKNGTVTYFLAEYPEPDDPITVAVSCLQPAPHRPVIYGSPYIPGWYPLGDESYLPWYAVHFDGLTQIHSVVVIYALPNSPHMFGYLVESQEPLLYPISDEPVEAGIPVTASAP